MDRPVYETNVQANVKNSKVKRLFLDFPKNEVTRTRFLPSVVESGITLYRVINHFKVIDENGKATALACLNLHGTEGEEGTGAKCYLCQLVDWFIANDLKDLAFGKKGSQQGGLSGSNQWYAQVLQAELIKDKWTYDGPFLARLPKTPVDRLNELASQQQADREPLYDNIEEGHDINIKRLTKTPWYEVNRAGERNNLNDIFPAWREKLIDDVYGKIDPNIVTREEQRECAVRAYGDILDFEKIDAEIPV